MSVTRVTSRLLKKKNFRSSLKQNFAAFYTLHVLIYMFLCSYALLIYKCDIVTTNMIFFEDERFASH